MKDRLDHHFNRRYFLKGSFLFFGALALAGCDYQFPTPTPTPTPISPNELMDHPEQHLALGWVSGYLENVGKKVTYTIVNTTVTFDSSGMPDGATTSVDTVQGMLYKLYAQPFLSSCFVYVLDQGIYRPEKTVLPELGQLFTTPKEFYGFLRKDQYTIHADNNSALEVLDTNMFILHDAREIQKQSPTPTQAIGR